MALSDLFNELEPKYASALSEVTASLRQEFDRKLAATRSELGLEVMPADEAEEPREAAPAAEPAAETAPAAVADSTVDSIAELKQAVIAIDEAESQGEVLASLVSGCCRFTSRCAVFLVRHGQVSGWTSHGFSLTEDEIKNISFAVDPSSPWDKLAAGDGAIALGAGDCGPLCELLGAEASEMGFLLPFVLNNQTAAGVYCDRAAGDEPPDLGALQLVTFIASQVLENLPVRDRSWTSTLRLAQPPAEATPDQPSEQPPVAGGGEVAASDEIGSAHDLGAPPVVLEETPDSLFELEPESDLELAAEEPAPPPEATAEETAAPTFEPASEPPAPPAPATPEPSGPARVAAAPPPDEISAEPEPDTPAAEPMPQAVETLSAVDDEPLAPAILSEASTQVAPPDDLEGPGWAFSGAGAAAPESGNDSQHEEARRLARLLVTEVKLYNEELVEKGRKNGDVYSVLREDIDRSRQIFNDRIAEDVRSQNDYFREALVRILAGGDPAVLGA